MKTRTKSWDHVNWWEPQHWKKGLRSISSSSLDAADPDSIRNGWLTLGDQARFQQKQMAEREMKIASLYEAQQTRALERVRHSPSSNGSCVSPPPNAPLPQGKVRQMFEERRTKKGIDKSYPLQPIHNTDRQPARKITTNGHHNTSKSTTTISNVKVAEKKTSRTTVTSVRKQHFTKTEKLSNGSSGDVNHNHEPDFNSNKQNINTVHQNGDVIPSLDSLDKADNNYLLEDETFPEALAPAPTPRTPEHEPKRPPRRSPAVRSSPARAVVPAAAPQAPPRRSSGDVASSSNKGPAQKPMQKTSNSVLRKQPSLAAKSSLAAPPASTAPVDAGPACSVCGRKFAPDRLEKHEAICKKAAIKKRKPFDALKHRLAGTEAEPFISKLRKSAPVSKQQSTTQTKKPLNSSWRQKHEEFIAAIRAAKQVQQRIAAGGKLSDLPPPPPSQNLDYVQCPHCSRRFNQAAADRHIPKCASYQFNKPKPSSKRR